MTHATPPGGTGGHDPEAHVPATHHDGHAAAIDSGGHHSEPEHGEDAEPLGPLDTAAWLAGAVGVAVGLVTAACFVLSVGSPI